MGAAGAEVRGCEWDLVDFFAGQAGKADGVAGLIYVPAHIKGPCTWPFPNHYRRTINHDHPLIAASRKMETGQQMHAWCNRGEVAEVRMGGEGRGGGYKTDRANRSQYLGKRPHQHKLLLLLLLLHREMGVKSTNRKFHINTITNQCKQSVE